VRRLIIAPYLQEIHDYIANDNLDAASHVLDRFDDRFGMLREHPGIGKKRNELPPGLRCIAEGNYLIVYRLVEQTVEIARVLHSKRNIRKILKSGNIAY
jgi:toxin ParE1/3/4